MPTGNMVSDESIGNNLAISPEMDAPKSCAESRWFMSEQVNGSKRNFSLVCLLAKKVVRVSPGDLIKSNLNDCRHKEAHSSIIKD